MEVLLKAGANVNIPIKDKSTALMEAATWDHLECVKLLLAAGADVNFATPESSALHLAAANANHRCVDALLSSGADVNNANDSVLAAAMCYRKDRCKTRFTRTMEKYIPENHSHSTCVKLLIGAEANVNMADNQGFTPLINAARHDHDDCIDLLVQAGASVNQEGADSMIPIVEAAILGTPKCLHRLIAAGADVNTIIDGGNTALTKWWNEITKSDEQ